MTRAPDDELLRVAAIEASAHDGPPSPVGFFARLALGLLVGVWLSGVVAGMCAPRPDPTDALRAREDTAHVRVHRAQMATAAALDTATRYAARSDAAVRRFRAQVGRVQAGRIVARPADFGTPPNDFGNAPKVLGLAQSGPILPQVPGGWGAVALDDTTRLPTPRVVIGALIARDSALVLADAAITEQRLALQKWAVAGGAFLAERAAAESLTVAVKQRLTAEIRHVKRQRWQWAGWGVGLGLVVGLTVR